MPDDPNAAPNPNVLSRELYNLIVGGSAIPVLLLLIGLSWYLINRYMNPEHRQERRNREIRQAIAMREERAERMALEKAKEDAKGGNTTP